MISLIVPIYNAEKYLKRCIDSILIQTYKEIEIILVNDGSNDNSLSIIDKYKIADSRIKVISQENKGVAVARNTGLKGATGEYILYVDSDDWIEPDMIEKMLLLADDADIVFCAFDNADTLINVKKVESIKTEIWNQSRQQFEFMKHKKMTGMLWNKLIKRSITVGCSFNEKTGYGEDAEFLWQILKNSKKMIVTNEILYHHVLEDMSISHLSFSEKKYSAIPMWEKIVAEVEQSYPELLGLAKERLVCAAVFSLYEIRKCGYKNKEQIVHMREITRKNIRLFLISPTVSKKFKLYALAVCMGVR